MAVNPKSLGDQIFDEQFGGSQSLGDQIFEAQFGSRKPRPAPVPVEGFWSSAGRSAKGMTGAGVAALGTTLEDVGAPVLGQPLRRYGESVQQANAGAIQSLGDIVDKPRAFLGESLGQLAAQVPVSMAGAAAGARAGAALPVPPNLKVPAAALGGAAGAFVPNLVMEYGETRGNQRETGQEDKGKALGAATAAAALDTLGDVYAVPKLLNPVKRAAELAPKLLPAGASRLGAVAQQGLKSALVEGPLTEIPQTALERWGGGKDLASPEALNEYGVAGAMGAVGGGVLGGVQGALQPRAEPWEKPGFTVRPALNPNALPPEPAQPAAPSLTPLPVAPPVAPLPVDGLAPLPVLSPPTRGPGAVNALPPVAPPPMASPERAVSLESLRNLAGSKANYQRWSNVRDGSDAASFYQMVEAPFHALQDAQGRGVPITREAIDELLGTNTVYQGKKIRKQAGDLLAQAFMGEPETAAPALPTLDPAGLKLVTDPVTGETWTLAPAPMLGESPPLFDPETGEILQGAPEPLGPVLGEAPPVLAEAPPLSGLGGAYAGGVETQAVAGPGAEALGGAGADPAAGDLGAAAGVAGFDEPVGGVGRLGAGGGGGTPALYSDLAGLGTGLATDALVGADGGRDGASAGGDVAVGGGPEPVLGAGENPAVAGDGGGALSPEGPGRLGGAWPPVQPQESGDVDESQSVPGPGGVAARTETEVTRAGTGAGEAQAGEGEAGTVAEKPIEIPDAVKRALDFHISGFQGAAQKLRDLFGGGD